MSPTKYTEIEGLTEATRLPRLGKIRLGIKVESKKTRLDPETKKQVPVTYPKEVDYFVVPPEVEEIYGKEPKELDILLPVNDRRVIFPQSYRLYGRTGLKCSGNGVNATYVNEQWEMVDRPEGSCPCKHYDDGHCKKMGVLQFILPKVTISGVYQITTQSVNSIIDVNSGLKYCIAQVGRFAWVPLKLKRVKTQTNHKGQPGTHYTLSLTPDIKLEQLNDLRADSTRLLEFSSHYSVEEPDLTDPAEGADVFDAAIEKDTQDKPTETSRKTPQEQKDPLAGTIAAAEPEDTPKTPPICPAEEKQGASESEEEVLTDFNVKITEEHYNEIIGLQSQLKVESVDELLFNRGLPAFNLDFPDALYEDLVELMHEAADKLPFVLNERQGQESTVTIDQARIIDGLRTQKGIPFDVFARKLIDVTGSNSLMKMQIKHVKDLCKWLEEHKGTTGTGTA
jgi:hypothetical protein